MAWQLEPPPTREQRREMAIALRELTEARSWERETEDRLCSHWVVAEEDWCWRRSVILRVYRLHPDDGGTQLHPLCAEHARRHGWPG